MFGGRWNSRDTHVVYCALDPATAILEVAVHKGFKVLDTERHVLVSALISPSAAVLVVQPGDVPNPNWLRPASPSAGQQAFGDALLERHAFVIIPSAVSTHSWNLLFRTDRAAGQYATVVQEPFGLDTRLHPAER